VRRPRRSLRKGRQSSPGHNNQQRELEHSFHVE
jgi:hypothetical protein